MNRILMIAYHYPPIQGSSGVHRTLSFSKYLPSHGWLPSILTVSRSGLTAYLDKNEAMIPLGTTVVRALSLDTVKHLSIFGKYPGRLAIPDRWITWLIPAVIMGYAHIRRHKPKIIFSTYPIATAHLIGYVLHRLTGIPWVADFRDPMAQDGYPTDLPTWRAFAKIEKRVFKHAHRIVFAAPGALDYYRERFPSEISAKGVVIENGYEEEMFAGIKAVDGQSKSPGACTTILHSGVIYPSERDPTQFFGALKNLKLRGVLRAGSHRIMLRSSGHDALFSSMLEALDLTDVVVLGPPVNYQEALEEMCACDALLVLQSSGCNFQIPAKIYEYLRAGRTIVALTDPEGDTAGVLRQAGVPWIARLDSEHEIETMFEALLIKLGAENENSPVYDPNFVQSYSREAKCVELAKELDGVLLSSNS
ncbi:MAG: hypothetical protein ACI915_003596 [Gammaproteobacteria bacterium]|jgi:hypothetical protein